MSWSKSWDESRITGAGNEPCTLPSALKRLSEPSASARTDAPDGTVTKDENEGGADADFKRSVCSTVSARVSYTASTPGSTSTYVACEPVTVTGAAAAPTREKDTDAVPCLAVNTPSAAAGKAALMLSAPFMTEPSGCTCSVVSIGTHAPVADR